MPEAWQIELCTQLNVLKSGRFFEPVIGGGIRTQTLALDSETAIPAIFEVFVAQNHTHLVEIFWWVQENRATRCFVLALYLCATAEGPAWMPEFERHIERFNEQEHQDRTEELTFILEHRSALAKVIAEILQKRDIEKYNSDFKTFENMATAGFGKSLPKWCKNPQK